MSYAGLHQDKYIWGQRIQRVLNRTKKLVESTKIKPVLDNCVLCWGKQGANDLLRCTVIGAAGKCLVVILCSYNWIHRVFSTQQWKW